MKMIWGIFKRDMCHATRNVIAVIVSMGLVVVPALYAWFNIAASWDPYGNTKALKVAVANNDKGYKSDLIPVRVNVGETIISTLHANDQLDWQFVKSDKAIDGVKSGEYYAAIVIPKGFSADMMTLFSPDIKHAQLKYYLNEKINPIAPHITDQGATTVVNTIDKTFAKTIAQVGLDLASSILHYSQSPQMAEYMRNLNGNLTTTADTLSGASQQVTSYSQLLGSANDIVDSTGKLLASATKAGKQAQNALKQGKSGATSLTSAGANVTSSVNTALDQVSGAFDQVAAKVNKAFDAIGKDSDTAASQLATLSEQISSGESLYDTYITSLNHMRESVEQLPDSDSAKQALLEAIDREITLLEAAKGDSQKRAQQLKDAGRPASTIENAAADLDDIAVLLQLFHGIVVIQIDGVVVLRRFRFPLIIIRFLGSLHALPHLVPDFLPIVPVRFPMHGLSHRDYACHGFGLPETLFGLLSRIVCKLTVSVRSCLLSFFSVHRFLF